MPYHTPIDSCRKSILIQHIKWCCITIWPAAISGFNSMTNAQNISKTQPAPWKKELRPSTNKNRAFYSKILKRLKISFRFYSNPAELQQEKMVMIHTGPVHLVWVKSKTKFNLINISETERTVGWRHLPSKSRMSGWVLIRGIVKVDRMMINPSNCPEMVGSTRKLLVDSQTLRVYKSRPRASKRRRTINRQ